LRPARNGAQVGKEGRRGRRGKYWGKKKKMVGSTFGRKIGSPPKMEVWRGLDAPEFLHQTSKFYSRGPFRDPQAPIIYLPECGWTSIATIISI
jgi:hypothetical protein